MWQFPPDAMMEMGLTTSWDNPQVTTHMRIIPDIALGQPPHCRKSLLMPGSLATSDCFTAGTLILAERGLIPIQNVQIGDRVLTHANRWMRVSSTMQTVKDTVVVCGEGHYGLETTGEHPFLARHYQWKNKRHRILHDAEWIPANQLHGGILWASPVLTEVETLQIPEVGGRGVVFCEEFWWVVGKWLADGVVNVKPKGTQHIRISCSLAEADETYQRVNFSQPVHFHAAKGEYHWSRERREHQVILVTSHNGLGVWLTEQFGKHAHGKSVPAWALTMPKEWRRALLEGYLFGDGTYDSSRHQYRFATVSKALAIGMRLLAISLGHACMLRRKLGGRIEAINGIKFTRKDQYWELHR